MKSLLKGGSGYVVDEGCFSLRWDGAVLQGLAAKAVPFLPG